MSTTTVLVGHSYVSLVSELHSHAAKNMGMV